MRGVTSRASDERSLMKDFDLDSNLPQSDDAQVDTEVCMTPPGQDAAKIAVANVWALA
jgi:hypothetical protein